MAAAKFAPLVLLLTVCDAWISQSRKAPLSAQRTILASSPPMTAGGSLHGQDACFLPLAQLEQDNHTPRIVQIAGAYPGLTKEEFFAVTSEPAATVGQWTYDFSDPEGPQVGTVAIEGSHLVASCEDPVVIIAEHDALGIPLPPGVTETIDLLVLVDRAEQGFAERKFLVLDLPDSDELIIRAYGSKSELPEDCRILGRVELVQIPWLAGMKPTKTGFMEVDEYF
mmetsp:Transcript_28271/g.43489  ORF Transcript_28271/g.43489 Transcript_28271/m.43489 type:complete len:225 (-) Transcript_28271:65-739(-)